MKENIFLLCTHAKHVAGNQDFSRCMPIIGLHKLTMIIKFKIHEEKGNHE